MLVFSKWKVESSKTEGDRLFLEWFRGLNSFRLNFYPQNWGCGF